MDKNYHQTKGSSAISNISVSDDSDSESDDEEEGHGSEAKEGKKPNGSKKATKNSNAQDSI